MTVIHPRRLIREHLDRAISRALRAPAEQFVNLWDDGFDPCGWHQSADDAIFPPVQPAGLVDHGAKLLETLLCTSANDNVQLRLLGGVGRPAVGLQRDKVHRSRI